MLTARLLLFLLSDQTAPNSKIVGLSSQGVDSESSTVPHVFALGDCLEGKPELTPVCVRVPDVTRVLCLLHACGSASPLSVCIHTALENIDRTITRCAVILSFVLLFNRMDDLVDGSVSS